MRHVLSVRHVHHPLMLQVAEAQSYESEQEMNSHCRGIYVREEKMPHIIPSLACLIV